MEITAVTSINHVIQLPNSPSKSEPKIFEKSTINHVESKVSGTESNNQETANVKNTPTVQETVHDNTNTYDNSDISPILFSFTNVSSSPKFARFKTSDKLTKVIETCKKLQKLSDQNASKRKDDKTESHIPSVVTPKPVAVNGEATKDILPLVQELTFTVPSLPDELTLSSDKLDSESQLSSSSNNSVNVSQSICESSNTSSQNASEAALKRFLFLFRPSDHEVLVRNRGVNMYRCNVCGGMYRQKFSLKRHFLRTHINFQYISKSDISNCKIAIPNKFIPQDCDPNSQNAALNKKKFKSSNAVFFEHNEARLMPGLYTCHICSGVKFDLEKELRQHYNTHSDVERKTFRCDICNASFFKKQILSRHLASHGEKILKKECRRCGAEFASKAEYQKHMISHSSGRVCKYCSKILSTSANRKRHEALHLGLKPYRCTHCGVCFAQSKDLDRHLRKQHTDVCHFCDICNKLFPSQASLNVHVHDKHSDHSLKTDNSSSPEQQGGNSTAKVEPIKVTLPIKLKICLVCKRSFSTFYAMMKHRTQAHPYYTKRRRNRKTMKQKMAQQAAAHETNRQSCAKVSKPLSTSPARRGRPPLDKTVKFGTAAYRPGSRWMSKREKELAKKEELEFYHSLSKNIAENLLHHVDGKTSQLSLKAYNFNDQQTSCNFEEKGRFPWSNFNFPAGYDVESALKTRGHEVKNDLHENLSNRDKCLYATGLRSVEKLTPMEKTVVNNVRPDSNSTISETLRIQINGIDMKRLDLEERKKLIGRQVQVTCLCCVCWEKFRSVEAFEDHSLNNHVNVDCPCMEIEEEQGMDSEFPQSLCRQHISADGMYFSCNVPPPLTGVSTLKCTKCKSDFKTCLDLHSHIVKCGNLRSSPSHIWKVRKHKRIKRTMKNRMTSTEQQDAINAISNDCNAKKCSNENKEGLSTKSGEKLSKPPEKSQFYKSGRLQTTSFTADMNYFKTKPTKPPNTQPSKRGRKSYASLSYRYKNASVPSTTNQCSQCKETFSTLSALNIHLQSHVLSQFKSSKQTGNYCDASPKNVNPDIGLQSKSVGVNNSIPNTAVETLNLSMPKAKPLCDNSRLETTPSPSPQLGENETNIQISGTGNKNFTLESQKLVSTVNKSIVVHKVVTNVPGASSYGSSEKPMDLSKSCSSKKTSNLNPSNSFPTKSALDIAIAAVQEYSQNLQQNEHISKLQKTVEKLTPKAKSVPTEVNSVSPKKLGRPKKGVNHSPDKFKKNLFPETVAAVTKPFSKLEETVKRLAENKAKTNPDLGKEVVSPSKVVQINFNAKPFQIPASNSSPAQTACSLNKNDGKKPSLPVSPSFSPTTNVTLSSTKFVPILIYSTPNKPVNIVGLTPSNKPLSPNILKPASGGHVPVSSSNIAKADSKQCSVSENIVEGESESSSSIPKADSKQCSVSENTVEGVADRHTTVSNCSLPEKKSDDANQLGSPQGRISPSLESIVNSIKQKLHSQDSPPHGDVPISWLEDEKFEIPSLPKSAVPTQSIACALSADLDSSSQVKDEAPADLLTNMNIESQNPTKIQNVHPCVNGTEIDDEGIDTHNGNIEEEKFVLDNQIDDEGIDTHVNRQEEFVLDNQIDDERIDTHNVNRQEFVLNNQIDDEGLDTHNVNIQEGKCVLDNKKDELDCSVVESQSNVQSSNCLKPLQIKGEKPVAEVLPQEDGSELIDKIIAESPDTASVTKPKKIRKYRKKKQLFTIRKNRFKIKAPNNKIAAEKNRGRPRKKGGITVDNVPELDKIKSSHVDASQLEQQESETKKKTSIATVIDVASMDSAVELEVKDVENVDNSNNSQPHASRCLDESNFSPLPLKMKKGIFSASVSSSNIFEENVDDPNYENSKLKVKSNEALNEHNIANEFNHIEKNKKSNAYIETNNNNQSIILKTSSKDLTNAKCSATNSKTVSVPIEKDAQPNDKISNSKQNRSASNSANGKIKDKRFEGKISNLKPPEVEQSNPIPKPTNPVTTAFGRNLASRMKEKMRQSFENVSLENLMKSDDGNAAERSLDQPCCSSASSYVGDDDYEYLKAIKREFDNSEQQKKHSCPFCMLEFAYLTNFRRHLRGCRSRLLRREIEPIQNNTSPLLQFLPKKDEVEHSMLNLLRHQSRQTQMLNEASTSGSKVDNKFRTYSCNVCHRIYLSLFKLLQHQVTHKLSTSDQNADGDSKEGETFSASDLEEKSFNNLEIDKNFDDELCGTDLDMLPETESTNKDLHVPKAGEEKDGLSSKTNEKIDELDSSAVTKIISTETDSIYKTSESNGSYVPVSSEENCKETKPNESNHKEPLKRKRGRPVGWRKNLHSSSKPNVKNSSCTLEDHFKAKSVLFRNKMGNSKGFKKRGKKFLTKPFANVTKLTPEEKCNSLVLNELVTDDDLNKNPAHPNNSNLNDSQNSKSSIRFKSLNKKSIRKSAKNLLLTTNNVVEEIKPVLPKPSKNGTNSNQAKDFICEDTKQFHIKEKSSLLLPKRKPGRPPKTLLPTPSTSKFTGFSQSSASRNYRKLMSRVIVIDPCSDSEDEEEEDTDFNRKKKVLPLKPCPICKEKFSASLILHRHIQLVHRRRSNSNVKKAESPETSPSAKKINSKAANTSSVGDFKSSEQSRSTETINSAQQPRILRGKTSQKNQASSNAAGKNKSFLASKKKSANLSSGETSRSLKNKTETVADDNVEIIKNEITMSDDETPLIKLAKSLACSFKSEEPIPIEKDLMVKSSFKKKTSHPIENEDLRMKINLKKKFRKSADLSIVNNNADSKSITTAVNIFPSTKNPSLSRSISTLSSDKFEEPLVPFTKNRRSSKRSADENSNVESMRSFSKTDPIYYSSSTRFFKRLRAQFVDSNSDSGSAKDSPTTADYIATSDHGSDSEISRKFRKGSAKMHYGSDTDAGKKTRSALSKVIPIDVSDADSDISIIAVTPARGFNVCTICNASFSRSFHLQRHMRQEHSSNSSSDSANPDVELSKRIRMCSICKEKFPTKLSLNQHIKIKHKRKSDPGLVKSSPATVSVKTLSAKPKSQSIKMVNAVGRSALSRQCRKPPLLPRLKRNLSKKHQFS